jgi:hypothetical protein
MRLLFIVMILSSLSMIVKGQGLELGINLIQRISQGNDLNPAVVGNSLEMQWVRPLKDPRSNLVFGSETGISSISSFSLLKMGFRKNLTGSMDKFFAEAGVLSGIALFRPTPLLIWGGEASFGYQHKRTTKNDFSLGIKFRYTIVPEYAKFSPLNNEILFPIFFRWHLNKKAP